MSERLNQLGRYHSQISFFDRIIAEDIASNLLKLLPRFVSGNINRAVLLCARDYEYVIQLVLPDNIRKVISWKGCGFPELLGNMSIDAMNFFLLDFSSCSDYESLNIELASKIRVAFLQVVISKLKEIDREQIECLLELCTTNNYDGFKKYFEKLIFEFPNIESIIKYCSLGGCSCKRLTTFLCLPSSVEMMRAKLICNDEVYSSENLTEEIKKFYEL
jgi:hypothetical protein